jgi:hypothetical protein
MINKVLAINIVLLLTVCALLSFLNYQFTSAN